MIVRLRLEAVNLILADLKRMLEELLCTTRVAPSDKVNECSYCQLCLDLWFAFLRRSLHEPGSVNPSSKCTLPCLYPVPLGSEYGRSLEELCAFVESLQHKLTQYPSQGVHDQAVRETCKQFSGNKAYTYSSPRIGKKCKPRQLVGRKEVETLVCQGLKASKFS